ncbi:MAG TPA: flagellar basal body P-ring formation chaperone FlgA [Dongiaceae bacterium]|nr:flagellar basal body P-ring formation chaperone FlgA [Dongiaceae bacterium]
MNRQLQEKAYAHKRLRYMRRTLALFAVSWLSWPVVTLAENLSTQAQVSTAIKQYVNALHDKHFSRVESDVQPLDTRMQLQPCDQPLTVEHRPRDRMSGRLTFRTSCAGSAPWTVHIAANIRTYAQVVVAAAGIPAGTRLSGKEMTLQEQDVSLQYKGFYRSPDELAGFMTKRSIPAGQTITPLQVDPARLVSKGENVAILAEGGGILIRTSGVALADGAMGDLIQVRNVKSNKIVEGRIVAPGQIQVSL